MKESVGDNNGEKVRRTVGLMKNAYILHSRDTRKK